MKTRKWVKGLGIAALVVIAAGGIGAALNGGGSKTLVEPGLYAGAEGASNDVIASVDKALGRPSSVPQAVQSQAGGVAGVAPVPAAAPALDTKGAPASREASTVIAPTTNGAVPATGAPLANIDDRKIVQTAALKLQVKDVGNGFEEIGRIATASGGFVASSSFSFVGSQQVANVSVRVPAKSYQDVLGQLRGIGARVDSETSNASDVTEEYSDLGARLRNLEATEGQLLGFLGQAKNISEVLQVQDRLNTTRTQIEQTKGRVALLDKLSDLATISVGLRPVAVPAKITTDGTNLGARVTEAWDNSLAFLGGIAGGVLTVLVFSWWLPFLLVPAWLVGTRYVRSRPTAGVVD